MISKSNTPLKELNEMELTKRERYYSVEFTVDELVPLYHFKLWNSQTMDLFVLVKEDSEILNRLEVGRVLKMKYYNDDISYPPEYRTTQINNITKDKDGRFSGHCLVGLSILPSHQNLQLN